MAIYVVIGYGGITMICGESFMEEVNKACLAHIAYHHHGPVVLENEPELELKAEKFDPIEFVEYMDKDYEERYDEDHRDNWFIPRSIGKVQSRSYNRSFNKIRSSLPRKFRKDDLLNLN